MVETRGDLDLTHKVLMAEQLAEGSLGAVRKTTHGSPWGMHPHSSAVVCGNTSATATAPDWRPR
jgi:hypothetical protein